VEAVSPRVWVVVAGVAVTTFALKAVGPMLLGGRELPPRLARVIPLLAPSLFGALIAVGTFVGPGRSLTVDARAAGLCAAAVALALRAPVIAVVVMAAGVTAAIRLIA
jgi:branched-subunit amino acid transport protein